MLLANAINTRPEAADRPARLQPSLSQPGCPLARVCYHGAAQPPIAEAGLARASTSKVEGCTQEIAFARARTQRCAGEGALAFGLTKHAVNLSRAMAGGKLLGRGGQWGGGNTEDRTVGFWSWGGTRGAGGTRGTGGTKGTKR